MTPCVFHAARRERVAGDESENESTIAMSRRAYPYALAYPRAQFSVLRLTANDPQSNTTRRRPSMDRTNTAPTGQTAWAHSIVAYRSGCLNLLMGDIAGPPSRETIRVQIALATPSPSLTAAAYHSSLPPLPPFPPPFPRRGSTVAVPAFVAVVLQTSQRCSTWHLR